MNIAIIGGGLSGLSTATLLSETLTGAHIDVFEKGNRPGGTIYTNTVDDFLVETGPNGFLSGKPTTLKLTETLGITSRLVEASREAEKRFILRGDELQQLPDSPVAFFSSGILSLKGKFRICQEPFIRQKKDDYEESVAEFGTRRLGKEAVQFMLDPMVSGVFAGNVDRLSLQSCFPRIYQLEQEYGSLVKAMFKLKSKKASPSGRLTSYKNGMVELINTMAERGGINVLLNREISGIEKEGKEFAIEGSDKKYHAVIFAIPAYQLAKINISSIQKIREPLENISYPPMGVVAFAVKKGVADGFGFLIPSGEKRKILGGLFSSQIFSNRGTDTHDLITVMLGGDRNHHLRDVSDQELTDIAASEISQIMKLTVKDLEQISLWRTPLAIPQYYKGHSEIVKSVENIMEQEKGLFITGNAFYGIGINDCTLASYTTADRVSQYLETL